MQFHSNNCFISMSRRAGPNLAALLGCYQDRETLDQGEIRNLKKVLVAALSDSKCHEVEESRNLLFVAHITVCGHPVVVNCLVTPGSPGRIQEQTLIVRGLMSLERYDELNARHPGTPPTLIFELDGQYLNPYRLDGKK